MIELILVMAIIGILSVIGIGSFTQATVKSKDTQRKNDLNQIAKALELYYNDALKMMLADKKRILAVEIKGGKYYDTGNKLEYLKTMIEFALKRSDINGEFTRYLKGLEI